jgi:hypothetical protein
VLDRGPLRDVRAGVPRFRRAQTGTPSAGAHVPPAVVDAVFAVHAEPRLLGGRLDRFPSTLLHGDAKLENLGLGSSGLVAIDWGDLTGFGPPEIDVAWYALMGADRVGCTPDDIFADYEHARGRPLDPEVLDLACIGSLAQIGFRLAANAYGSEETKRDPPATQLTWWNARVEAALTRVGPL